MKSQRLNKIIELIDKYEIGTQEELCEYLNREGFLVTQATVSRDIRQLKLTKVTYEKGQKYVASGSDNSHSLKPGKYTRVLKDAFVSMDMAQNILVIKTASGMAMAVAAALDNMNLPEIVGSIAGDDAIFCAVRSVEETKVLMKKIEEIIH